jgi:hypothetical protein
LHARTKRDIRYFAIRLHFFCDDTKRFKPVASKDCSDWHVGGVPSAGNDNAANSSLIAPGVKRIEAPGLNRCLQHRGFHLEILSIFSSIVESQQGLSSCWTERMQTVLLMRLDLSPTSESSFR